MNGDDFEELAAISAVLADEDENYLLDDGQCPFSVCRVHRDMGEPHRSRCPKGRADAYRQRHRDD